MNSTEIILTLPANYTEEQLKKKIRKKTGREEFTYRIEKKSLDARDKKRIHWRLRVVIDPSEAGVTAESLLKQANIVTKKRDKKILVTGSGPAGYFAALLLQKSGFNTLLIERGSDVKKRDASIRIYEKTGIFDPLNNYSFGEGGAGTFSDGKLTSRTKHLTWEKQFIISSYIEAGAPEEILYLTHPHLGSDNLKKIVENLRGAYLSIGGQISFEECLRDLKFENNRVVAGETSRAERVADYFIIAPGHSAYDTYRMLIKRGVKFKLKNFAIGSRVEHLQELINLSQWGVKELSGIKAAEYRLTSKGAGTLPVYTFCMCPGGKVVPAAAMEKTNIVNGMSSYSRNGRFANSACVAGVNLDRLLKKEVSVLEALDWVEKLERSFYDLTESYRAPFCSIDNFIRQKGTSAAPETSYPLGLTFFPLWDLFPSEINTALKAGLMDFDKKVKNFRNGTMLGLESKTSSPIQVERENNGSCAGIENLFIAGEGSGFSGGIISSAADGIKTALNIIRENS